MVIFMKGRSLSSATPECSRTPERIERKPLWQGTHVNKEPRPTAESPRWPPTQRRRGPRSWNTEVRNGTPLSFSHRTFMILHDPVFFPCAFCENRGAGGPGSPLLHRTHDVSKPRVLVSGVSDKAPRVNGSALTSTPLDDTPVVSSASCGKLSSIRLE